jgi:hypothetical protein
VPASRLDIGELMAVGRMDVGDKQTGVRFTTLYRLAEQPIGKLRRIVRQASPEAGRYVCPSVSPKIVRPVTDDAGRSWGVRCDRVEWVVRVDGVVCLDAGGQRNQTRSNVDRPPAAPVEVGGVRFDGVEWVVRFGGVMCVDYNGQIVDGRSMFCRVVYPKIVRPAPGEAGRKMMVFECV